MSHARTVFAHDAIVRMGTLRMRSNHTATLTADEKPREDHDVSPSDIAVGVIIGRTSESFDFFAFAIASVIVFPSRLFPFVTPLEGVLWSFILLALAFIARPLGTVIFIAMDARIGRVAKLTIALFLLGTCTVGMGLVPGYETLGMWSIAIMAALRIGQGLALGGAWDGLPSLLAMSATANRKGFYAMIPQLGAPIGLSMVALVFAYLLSSASAADFLDWGWRYPFFVAFALNVVALFARLRIVASPEISHLFEDRSLTPSPVRQVLSENPGQVFFAMLVPLASFAMFHMVTVFPLSWIYLYTDQTLEQFLILEALGSIVLLLSTVAGGYAADRVGRGRILLAGAMAIGAFALVAPLLLSMSGAGTTIYMFVGFAILGVSFAVSSGAIADLFDIHNRYTASALVASLSWLFGAGFAPLTAMLLSTWLGLWAAGLYLLSGAVCTILTLLFVRRLYFRKEV